MNEASSSSPSSSTAAPLAPPATRLPRLSWVARWLGGGLVLAAVLWLGSYFWLPWLVKSQLERQGTAQLGRVVTVGQVHFKPWSLLLTLDDLAVAARTGATPQLRIQRLLVDADAESLWRLAPVMDAIQVEGPQLQLTRDPHGAYDIDDVVAKFAAQPAKPANPSAMSFALFNLSLSDGAVTLTDQRAGRTHELRGLRLGVPFLSNLPSQREVKVLPHLAFDLNGSRFDSAAVSTPFTSSHHTDATLKISGLDLKPYLTYLPTGMPVKLESALLDVDLKLGFEQSPQTLLRLSGVVEARNVGLATPAGQRLLTLDAVKLGLTDVRPLERVVTLGTLELQSPQLQLQRDADGQLHWPRAKSAVGGSEVAIAKAKGPSSPTQAASGAAKPAATSAPGAWQIALQQLAVHKGGVQWTDQSLPAQARLDLKRLELIASGLHWPVAKPVAFQGSGVLEGQSDNGQLNSGQLNYRGAASLQAAQVTATVGQFSLAMLSPYLKPRLQPRLEGILNADLAVDWKSVPGGPGDLGLVVNTLTVDKLALVQQGEGPGNASPKAALARPSAVLASVQQLAVQAAEVKLNTQSVKVASISVKGPKASLERGADQRWMFERWLLASEGRPAKQANSGNTPVQTATPPSAWKLGVGDFTVEGGALRYADWAAPKPVQLDISGLNLSVKNLLPGTDTASPVQLSARIGAGQVEPGSLAVRGTVALQPLAVQASVEARHLPAHALAPYGGDALRLELLRADASYLGQVQFRQTPQGPALALTGDVGVEEFRANSVASSRRADPAAVPPAASSEATRGSGGANAGAPDATSATRSGLRLGNELLSWKSLSLRGVELALSPTSRTRVEVKETTLSDFFARVLIRENGRINLQDLVAGPPEGGAKAATATATADKPSAAPSAPVAKAGSGPLIRVGPISLLNGKVFFTDRFIKPNYSADLSELTGRLGGFSSEPDEGGQFAPADLSLRGRAEGTAALEIAGKLNPLAKPMALDIQAKVRDLELSPLSAYAIKYVGHGIERGKLSMDVAYVVKPDGQLTASNKLVLNQLTFGDPVDGAKTSLPVKLAVALLADSHGVIDLDLPLSGSLNDPQFSLGPVIFKVVMNVIGKALTAPFSLLAKAFSSNDQEALAGVSFPPGSARLTEDAQSKLDKVAKALADRPALALTVVGAASLDVEREAFQRERLLGLLRAEKRRQASTSEGSVSSISDEEYPVLLKEVYRRAEMPKPRNLVGMLKEVPVADMEKLLLANLPASADALRNLALQRGVVVKEYLTTRQVASERLFLGAVKMVQSQPSWTPSAELSLSSR